MSEKVDLQILRKRLGSAKRWVVKIGSALITKEGVGLNTSEIENWAKQLSLLQAQGIEVVLVASGSVAEGAMRLGWSERPRVLSKLQAAAAVGQMGLVRSWDEIFERFGKQVAQILLTHEDIADRQRYLNARTTLLTLLDLGVLPVVNENDSVATTEISLGDNDTLAGFVTNLVDADLLLILTDQHGIMTADPRIDPSASLISDADIESTLLETVAGDGGTWGRGGMRTKIKAARLAARSGSSTIIANGSQEDVIVQVSEGEQVGTLLYSSQAKLSSRKRWLGGTVRPSGVLVIDDGAYDAIRRSGRSLLPVGVLEVRGEFSRGELVTVETAQGNEVGRGLVNYSSVECLKIRGQPSVRLELLLGFIREPELIHRDNLFVDIRE